VFLDDDAGAAAARRDRLDALHPPAPADDVFAGTPPALADLLEERPGVRLLPAAIPHDLRAITRGLVPELQARGRVPRAYAAGTLRERLGLGSAVNRYAPTASPSVGVDIDDD
jgi:hypothetical protein